MKWFRKAADQGNAVAQNNLGYCYRNGEGVEQDYAEAVKWGRKAADQGNAVAQNNLGYCYQNGEGVKQDKKEAAKWYQKAADQGNKDAQKNLKNLSGCFITTAVCQTFHKPDDCYELTMFRHFRDNWLSKQPNGKDMIAEYYVVAPSIVEKIDSSEYPDQVYRKIWKLYLNPCLHYLENRQYEDCRNLYVEMVTKLKKKCKVDVE
ncbi:stress protein [Megasphaera elsdenii CAG:570]|uniref:Stress protein n=1 Tax=Megasphaera elsdenii CAG:570 TaxID=1263087 RepID=R7MZP3_MEGEL|nr:stress protein [Megasphaera elsdenii CAG:570]